MTIKENIFLTASIWQVFYKTATPLVLVMLVSGSFSLFDAYFVGVYVGEEALTAVTLMFPAFILIVALSTLLSSGFAIMYARLLGQRNLHEAKCVFAQSNTLSIIVSFLSVAIFAVFGADFARSVANGSEQVARMGYLYIGITFLFTPVQFILGNNFAALRCEGKSSTAAVFSIASVALNVIFNYLLIVVMGWGVAGSALGTVLAQMTSLMIIACYKSTHRYLPCRSVLALSAQRDHWWSCLRLGAPSSLNYVGIALVSMTVIYCLKQLQLDDYNTTVSAYGIVTRVMTFIYLPLLGLGLALQTVVGHNFGARQWLRINSSIKLALLVTFLYCLGFQGIIYMLKASLGLWFVDNVDISREVANILPKLMLVYFLLGPSMMLSIFFQSIGDTRRAMLLSLAKPYLFSLPLTIILSSWFGVLGIWYAAPVAETLSLLLIVGVLYFRSRHSEHTLGLFYSDKAEVMR
ncbi:putative MATE family efflux protein [Sinobacterium caligoides]|uniref:Multidrug export protein MepA n=1 Tax=Sinobacterium caligoides TaxID=933926 RepID=A0A3N2E0N3_9GAMM|nr:MATE family efflux transporter [Sinobacterium caligoides]ROS05656.1 putative MATE family efflux protein [Sinobacterium caligoides]